MGARGGEARSEVGGEPVICQICLELDPEPVQALVHEPAPDRGAGTSLLICAPFGWDEMCSYRPRRTWACRCAEAGILTVRFDLPGTGDSGGRPSDRDLLSAWIGAVAQMISWLNRQRPANRLAVLGIGLGGMLAWRAMDQGAPVDELILWSVPSEGRRLLRELRAQATMIAQPYREDHHQDSEDEMLDLVGYAMTPETAEALSATDLTAAPVPSRLERVLLLSRDGIAPDARLQDHLRAHDVPLTVARGDGYGDLTAHPQRARARPEPIEVVVRWLTGESSARRPQALSVPEPAAPPAPPKAVDAMVVPEGGQLLRETPFAIPFGAGRMFGVACEPIEARRDLTAVLFNAGALRHIGPHRFYVELARRWTARGVSTVRVDLCGIGEAEDGDGGQLTNFGLNDPIRIPQVLAVLEHLRDRGSPPRFILVGLCSGAFCALHGALADPTVVAAVMVNLNAFQYSDELAAERNRRASAAALRGNLVTRVTRGRLRREHLVLGVRSFSPRNLRRIGHSLEAQQGPDIELAFDQLREAGTQLTFMFSRGEPMDAQLERGGQWGQLERWPNIALERLPTREHLFRALWLQGLAHDAMDRALDRVLARGGNGTECSSAELAGAGGDVEGGR